MQTQVSVDSELLQQAIKMSGAADERSAVESALLLLADIGAQAGIRSLRGKVQWEGDLDDMRTDRPFE